MKHVILVSLLSGVIFNSAGQSLSPTVVASSGGFFSNPSGMLSETAGELAAITTLASASNFLTQGFQQTFDFNTAAPDIEAAGFSFSVFPNPSSGIFFIRVISSEPLSISIAVYDVPGKKIISSLEMYESNSIVPLDLSRCITGMYLLECTITNSAGGRKNIFYSKLNLVY